MSKKFPHILHVTLENPSNDEPYFQVNEGGIFDAAEAGRAKRCALYKLIEVGVVVAPPAFVSAKRSRKK